MTRIYALFFALTLASAVPGCAGKFPADIWPALKACGSNDVSWGTATEVFGDLVEIVNGNPAGEADLLVLLANDVGGAIPCLVAYFESQGGSVGAAAATFKAGHAKELKAAAARGPVSCNGFQMQSREMAAAHAASSAIGVRKASSPLPTGRGPLVASVVPASAVDALGVSASPAKVTFAYAGPNPGSALAHCYRQCGDNIDALAPPGGCQCWRQVGSTWRWVAAR